MSLSLPVFKGTHCVSITACGEIQKPSRELSQWMAKQKTMAAPLGIGSEKSFFRVWFGGESGAHLHLDVTKQSMYSRFKPKNLSTIGEIQKALARFDEMEIESDLTGLFEVDLDDLPDGGIIRSLFFQTKTGDVAIKVAGAVLSITGAPVSSISWRALRENKIGITMESSDVKTKVTVDYLTTAVARLESALNVFVLGKPSNEQGK